MARAIGCQLHLRRVHSANRTVLVVFWWTVGDRDDDGATETRKSSKAHRRRACVNRTIVHQETELSEEGATTVSLHRLTLLLTCFKY